SCSCHSRHRFSRVAGGADGGGGEGQWTGAAACVRRGVGLSSLRERAEELGGVCLIEAEPTGERACLRLFPCIVKPTKGHRKGKPSHESYSCADCRRSSRLSLWLACALA